MPSRPGHECAFPDRPTSGGLASIWRPTPIKILLIMLAFVALRQMRPLENYYPLLWPDSWGYLLPALRWLKDGYFETIYGRTFGYPLFLTAVLQTTHSFMLLGVVQKALNLLGGWLVLSVMAQLIRQESGKARMALAWLFALAFIWLFMGNTSLQIFEHYLLPESIAPVVMGVFIYLLWYAARRLIRGEDYIWPMFLLAVCSVAAFYHKPNWGFAAMSPLIMLLLLKAARGTRFIKPALTYSALFLLIFAPMYLWQKHVSRHDPSAITFTPVTLFTWHLNGIKGLLEKDAQKSDPPFDPALIRSVNGMLDHQFALDRHRRIWYPSLGYNPDEIFYSPDGFSSVPLLKKLSPEQKRDFFLHYFFRYALTQPGRYLKQIGRQMAIFYNFKARLYENPSYREVGDVRKALNMVTANLHQGEGSLPWVQDYLLGLRGKLEHNVLFDIHVTLFKKAVYGILRVTYYPVMLAVLAGWSLLAYFKRRRGRELSPTGALMAVLALSCLGTAVLIDLTAAAVHSLDVSRYFYYHFTLTLTAQWLGLMSLLWLLLDWAKYRRDEAKGLPGPA